MTSAPMIALAAMLGAAVWLAASVLLWLLFVFVVRVVKPWFVWRESMDDQPAIYPREYFLRCKEVVLLLSAVIAWLFDVAYNAVFGTLMFLQLPWQYDTVRSRRTLTFSDRLSMNHNAAADASGWRYRLSFWVCKTLLNPIDPSGKHC